MLSLVAAHPIPVYTHSGSSVSVPAMPVLPDSGAIWDSIDTFRQNLSDPRFFTIVLFVIAVLNFLTVVLALVLYRVTRREPEPTPMPRRAVPHLRAVSVDSFDLKSV